MGIIAILDKHLPIEITDLIYKKFHRLCMQDIIKIIRYKIVFILWNGKLSFLICEHQNYYNALDIDNDIFISSLFY